MVLDFVYKYIFTGQKACFLAIFVKKECGQATDIQFDKQFPIGAYLHFKKIDLTHHLFSKVLYLRLQRSTKASADSPNDNNHRYGAL